MKSKKAIYPGSFDPITNGHLDILDRASKIFGEIVVVVAGNDYKTPLLSIAERVALIKKVVSQRPNITVDHWPGLIMEYASKHEITALIRGLRGATDFEYEYMMAGINRKLNPDAETFFMMTSQDLFFVSSSMVKELHEYGGDIRPYVPKDVIAFLEKKRGKKK